MSAGSCKSGNDPRCNSGSNTGGNTSAGSCKSGNNPRCNSGNNTGGNTGNACSETLLHELAQVESPENHYSGLKLFNFVGQFQQKLEIAQDTCPGTQCEQPCASLRSGPTSAGALNPGCGWQSAVRPQ